MSRTARERRQNLMAIFAAFAAGIAILVVAIGYFKFAPTPIRRDPGTLCSKEGAPTSLLVILIDTTDALNVIKRAAVKDEIQAEVSSLPIDGEVQLYTLGPVVDSLLKPEIVLCNPGNGKGASEWTANPRLLKKRWTLRFERPLDDVLGKMLIAPDGQTSPILESIQDLSVTVLQRHEYQGVPKQLVIVSDMIQYTSQYSQYRSVQPFSLFSRTAYYRDVHADLSGVDVTLLYIIRPEDSRIQNANHLDFWRDYIAASGGRLIHYKPI